MSGDPLAEFRRSRLPAIAPEQPASQELLKAARAITSSAQFSPFDLAHVGHYEVAHDPISTAVLDELLSFAAAIIGRPCTVAGHRWVRMRCGDYSLCRDDAAWASTFDAGFYDLCLDLSEAATGEAEIVFTHRDQAFFTVPQRPGQLALVARGPTVARYDRYLTHRVGERTVTRLRLAIATS